MAALTPALARRTPAALPGLGALPAGWHAHGAQRGRASLVSLVLARLDERGDLPAPCLPGSP